jgi:hypothetical protein
LGHDPIVLVADRIYIELEEPYELKPLVTSLNKNKQKQQSQQKQQQKSAPGFIDRILDNIKFEVKEIQFKVKTLGKHRRFKEKPLPSAILLHIRDIVIHSTNSKWQVRQTFFQTNSSLKTLSTFVIHVTLIVNQM